MGSNGGFGAIIRIAWAVGSGKASRGIWVVSGENGA
jgi:hypothetical protein